MIFFWLGWEALGLGSVFFFRSVLPGTRKHAHLTMAVAATTAGGKGSDGKSSAPEIALSQALSKYLTMDGAILVRILLFATIFLPPMCIRSRVVAQPRAGSDNADLAGDTSKTRKDTPKKGDGK